MAIICERCRKEITENQPAFHRNGVPVLHAVHYQASNTADILQPLKAAFDPFAGENSQRKPSLEAIEWMWR